MDNNRKTAFETLVDIQKNEAYSNISLNKFILKNEPDNTAFLREIVYGTLKNQMLLDFHLKRFVEKGYDKLKVCEKTLLRMGAYQILFMDSVPDYAAINETVNLAKKYAKGKDKFINGVLRNLSRNISNLATPKDLETKYSVSKWIVDLLLSQYGLEKTEEILKASNETPNLSIRVNILKTSKEELKDKLLNKGFEVIDSKYSNRALLVKGSGLLDIDEFKAGLFSVQDESSIVAIDTLAFGESKNNMRALDLCAAPGGKTFSLREILPKDALITSIDTFEHKLELMNKEIARKDYKGIELKLGDSTKFNPEFENQYDIIISDVPCSGLGVLRRKPEIKYKKEYNFSSLLKTQEDILNNAGRYLKDGGCLLYSTCTINEEENSKQVEKFIERNPMFQVEKELKLLPDEGLDGFYICKMRKNLCK